MKTYIAGPMSDRPAFNRPAFHLAATHLMACGHTPLNPATLPDGLAEADYMAIGIAMLQRAEAIYLLDGWQSSVGAKAEFALAEKLGLKVIYQEKRPPGNPFYILYDSQGRAV
ncbi:DUF4406 domain-containing protein [Serratia marcescens]|uniref:DUF4406 domain-containing protein n=1 Tax=Serratia marcescens TaxID=615 RepID=UPI001249F7ED|nr:DUF4406 domain-containing protein [Serratia marcescens]KAB1578750.1 DUF4406 domain-containing protein [Serratia marcescens]